MNKEEIVDKIINSIEENFLFLQKDNEIWDLIKCNIKKLGKRDMGEAEFCSALDMELSRFNDPHTRLEYVKAKDKIFNVIILPQGNSLYYIKQDLKMRIVAINGISIDEIYAEYSKLYHFTKRRMIQNEICKNIRMGNERFDFDTLLLEYLDKDVLKKETLHRVDTKQLLQEMNLQMKEQNFQMMPVLRLDYDKDTVLLKIISFRNKNLVSTLSEMLSNIQDTYHNIILDIRENVGGYVEVAQNAAALFLKEDVELNYNIMLEDRTLKRRVIKKNLSPYIDKKKIYVFINENTMSSAEFIFASALKHSCNDAVFIGKNTFGLSGQAKQILLEQELMLTITVKRYLNSKNGQEIVEGIDPDYYIQEDCSEEDYKECYKRIKEYN